MSESPDMTDLRLALRLCFRHPLLSLAAIGSLALGIGANTAIFTVLNGSVLRPLPYQDPSALMVVWETGGEVAKRPVAPATFLDWRRDTSAFSGSPAGAGAAKAGLAAFDDFSATLTGMGEAQRVQAVSASANFFEVLGVRTQLGRAMTADDDRPDAARVAVLTDGFWHQQFGGAADVLGKTLTINDTAHTIVGVLPPDFSMPMVPRGEVWVTGDRGIPRSFPFPGDITAVRDSHIIQVIGRLAIGATPRTGPGATHQRDELRSRSATRPATPASAPTSCRCTKRSSATSARCVVLLQIAVGDPAADRLRQRGAPAARPGGRRGRPRSRCAYALGADRSRMVRQLLIETLIIAVPGGIAGLALAVAGVRALVLVAPANLPRLAELSVDTTVLAVHGGDDAAHGDRVRPGPGDADARARRRTISAASVSAWRAAAGCGAATRPWSSASWRSRRRCWSARACCWSASCMRRASISASPPTDRVVAELNLGPSVHAGRPETAGGPTRRRRSRSSPRCSIASARRPASAASRRRSPRH